MASRKETTLNNMQLCMISEMTHPDTFKGSTKAYLSPQ